MTYYKDFVGKHGPGKWAVHHVGKGYNRTTYGLELVEGVQPDSETLSRALGGDPYCGGTIPRDVSHIPLGQRFSVEVMGCD